MGYFLVRSSTSNTVTLSLFLPPFLSLFFIPAFLLSFFLPQLLSLHTVITHCSVEKVFFLPFCQLQNVKFGDFVEKFDFFSFFLHFSCRFQRVKMWRFLNFLQGSFCPSALPCSLLETSGDFFRTNQSRRAGAASIPSNEK